MKIIFESEIAFIHLKEKLKFIQKPFIKINGMLKEINF
jgi:hypothetical protein